MINEIGAQTRGESMKKVGRRLGLLLVVLLTASMVACASLDDFCGAVPATDSSVRAVDRLVGGESSGVATRSDNRGLFVSLIERLTLMREAAPRTMRGDIGTLLAAYGQLAVAYEAVDWDAQIAVADPSVDAARALLTEESVFAARESFVAFVAAECASEIDPVQLGELLVPTTLPLPSFSEEPAADAPDTDEEDVLSAVGFFVAERYGIAVTAQEAQCLGELVATTDVLDSADENQSHTWFVEAFALCEIASVPSTVGDTAAG